ncbi:MAG: CBS domain-containing protein [Mariprofundaceae bacterium]
MGITAKDIMTPNPPTCAPDAPLEEVARRFADESLTGLLVTDEEGGLLGIVTESDLIDQQKNLHLPTMLAVFDAVIPLGEARFEQELARMKAMTAGELMRREVRTVEVDTPLADIADLMAESGIHHLPVIEAGRVVGMITQHEVIRALAQH